MSNITFSIKHSFYPPLIQRIPARSPFRCSCVARKHRGYWASLVLACIVLIPSSVHGQAPSITSLNPTSGTANSTVTITGSNFGATQASSTVTFNGTTALPMTWSATSIVAVPCGATTGSVKVNVGVQASNGVNFTVTNPSTPWGGIIDPCRAVDWSNAGMPGGIPNRTTICATPSLTASTADPGASVRQTNTDTINNAIATATLQPGCTSGGVVSISAGTYWIGYTDINSNPVGIDFNQHSNVTLRGAGADQTFLIVGGGRASCWGQYANICVEGSGSWQGAPDNTAHWTGTTEGGNGVYPVGATHLTLDNVANLVVGNTVILDQTDDPSDGFPAIGDIFVCGVSGVAGSCVGQGTHAGRTGKGQQQTVTVTGINGTTVTVSPGLAMTNWRSSQNPGAWWATTVISGVGIENLTLDNSAGTGALCSGCGNVVFLNAVNSWVKGVRSIEHNGTGGNAVQSHVRLYQAAHITVQDNYLYGSDNSSQSYGIEPFESSDLLIQNNICQHVTSCTVANGPDSGSVIAYNFSIDDNYTANGTASQWMQPTHIWHEIGQTMELYEGNSGLGFQADNIHGTHHFGTFFRNNYYGDIWNNPTKNNNTEIVHLWKYSRFFNIIGNVLGRANYYDTYQGLSATSIFNVNGDSDNEGGESSANDPRVSATLLRWGNYDTFTGAARWCGDSSDTGWSSICATGGTEVPSQITNYSNPRPTKGDTGAGQAALPASFYLNSAPNWWVFPSGTAAPFPAIGPDVSGGNGPAGHSYYIPAENCWRKVMGGAVGTSGLLSFNANSCYYPQNPSAPTIAQMPQVSLSYSVSTNSVTFPGLSAGQTIAGFLIWTLPSSVTLINITDNCGSGGGSDVYTLLHNPTAIQNGGTSSAEYWGIVGTSGSCTITANFSGSANSAFAVVPVSGANATAPVDQSGVNGSLGYDNYNPADSATSGSVTTTAANELVLGFLEASGSFAWTAGTGFTADVNNGADHMLEHKTLSSPGSVAATAQNTNSTSAYPGALILTLKP